MRFKDIQRAFGFIRHPGGLRLREFAARVWQVANATDVANRASELAYSFLLAVFPFFLFAVAMIGLFASAQTALRANLLREMARILPPEPYDLLAATLDEIIHHSGGGKLTLGLLLTLISGSGGMAQMITTLNSAYELPERRSWLRVRVLALALTGTIAVLLVTVLVIGVGGAHLASLAVYRLGASPIVLTAWRAVEWILAAVFLFVTLQLVEYFGPDRDQREWRWITIGSIVSVFLWLLASIGLRIYVHYFGTFTRAYGSLGAAIVLLLWFYMVGLSALIGGVINSVIAKAEANASKGRPPV